MNFIKAEKLVCIREHMCGVQRSLDEISFSVSRGEMLCVLGAAGAGKTCLAHALAGLFPIQSGKLHVCGMDMCDEINHWEIRKKSGIVFAGAEDMFLTNSVQTELAFVLRNFGADEKDFENNVANALAMVELEDFENRSVPLLCSFDRYCLAIAAAIVHKPEILVLDSVAGNFDAIEREKVFDILRNLRESGVTVIYTTQDAQDALISDRVLMLKEGRMLAMDEPRVIIADAELLTNAKVELPFTVRVYQDLLEAGAKLERCPLDIDELVEEICK